MYVSSADPSFHANRTAFHEEIFSVLSPILGSPEVRVAAARGIYGGELPGWYKDLESEAIARREAKEKAAAEVNAKVEEKLEPAAPPRISCRYGAKCYRKGAEHRDK